MGSLGSGKTFTPGVKCLFGTSHLILLSFFFLKESVKQVRFVTPFLVSESCFIHLRWASNIFCYLIDLCEGFLPLSLISQSIGKIYLKSSQVNKK